MRKFPCFIFFLIVLGFNLSYFPSYLYACVGARPLSMGGAFVGVADDANATYWNPAGLTQLEGSEFTYTPTLRNRDEVNYDDFVSLAFPLYLEKKDLDLGSLGFSFVNSGYKTVAYRTVERWYWLSYGKKLPLGFSLGFNARNQYYKDRINEGWQVKYGDTWVPGPNQDTDETTAFDLSVFWKWEKFSFGLLCQDVNEPEVTLFGVKSKYIRNLRPGFALRPDDKTILSFELYDATGESKDSDYNVRVGLERLFNLPWEGTSLALRLGGYDINADEKAGRSVTGGFGYKWRFSGLARNDRELPLDLSIDYAVMYWTDVPSGTDDLTHMLGFKVSIPWESLQSKTLNKESRNNTKKRVVPSDTEIKVLTPYAERKILPPQQTMDEETYFRTIKERIAQNMRLPAGLEEDRTVKVDFSLSSEGQLKDVYKIYTEESAIKEEITKVLKATTFPSAPEELSTKNEIRFALFINFLVPRQGRL